jgi:hypothetical protein
MDSPIQPEAPAPVGPANNPPSDGMYDEAEFKRRLTDEYKILQDKIDKIGAFRFTIKGWSVTAVVAASAAGAASKGLSTVLTLSGGLIIMLIFFFFLEYEQVMLSRLYAARAGSLEDAFRRIDRGKGKELRARLFFPYTAHTVVFAGHNQKAIKWPERWRVCRQTHVWFYIVLVGLALAALAPRHRAISEYWKHRNVKNAESAPAAASPKKSLAAPSTEKTPPAQSPTPKTVIHK